MDVHGLLHNGALFPLGMALIFAFSNGFRDSSTIVATVVSTRTLSPTAAFLLCALFEFCGALLIGSAVASTISSGLIGKTLVGSGGRIIPVLEAGLAAAFIWGVVSWWRAWPTSNNHALVAGLSGAAAAEWGFGHFHNGTIYVMLFILITSPLIGFLISSSLTWTLRKAGEWMTPKAKTLIQGFHVFACLMVSSAHGSNDGQMVMGVLMTVLGGANILSHAPTQQGIPLVVRLCVAAAISGGVLLGGRRILKRMGMKFFRIRETQGLGAQMSSAGTILACGLLGFPASTTQVIAGSIVGAGVAKNPRAVRWHIVQEIILSWVLTLPSVAILAFVLCKLIQGVGI